MKRLLGALVVKKILLTLLAASLVSYQRPTYAFVAPAANFAVNRMLAQAMTRVAIQRGMQAADPRIAATLTHMGTVTTGLNVVSTAAGVGLAVAGAPVWLGIAAGLGIIGIGVGVKAYMNQGMPTQIATEIKVEPTPYGNKLSYSVPGSPLPPYMPPQLADSSPQWAQAVTSGAPIYRDPINCYANESCYSLPLAPSTNSYRYPADHQSKTWLVTTDLNTFGRWFTYLKKPMFTNPPDGGSYIWEFSSVQQYPNSVGGSAVSVYVREARVGSTNPDLVDYDRIMTYDNAATMMGTIGPQYYPDLDTALMPMPQEVAAAKVTTQTLARLLDAVWQRAAMQPGYEGLPYSYANPVTETELAILLQEQPQLVPTITDLLTPASNPGTTTVVISPTVYPSTNPTTPTDPTVPTNPSPGVATNVNVVNTPNVNVTNQVRVDLGENPNVGSPGLESTPTAEMILAPLLGLFPSLRNFVVPAHDSLCPQPEFDMFGTKIVMDTHCMITENVRPALYAVMAAVWVLLGLFIVLAA